MADTRGVFPCVRHLIPSCGSAAMDASSEPRISRARPKKRMKHLEETLPSFFLLCFAFSALVRAASSAFSQPYPNKPVRLIVPYPAGGATDVVARLVAERMSEDLGQQIV